MTKPRIAAGIVVYNDTDKVLLVRHTEKARFPNTFGFPGGKAEGGETLESAAIRELEEETGLVTTIADLEKLPERQGILKMKDRDEYFRFQPYLCRKYSGRLQASEKTVPTWVKLDDLDNIPLIAEDVKVVARTYHSHYKI